jgi:putative membrane protein
MSFVTRYWSWATPGAYYGMPWSNLFGWFVTGVLLMAVFELLRADAWVRRLPAGWMAGFWGANLLLPMGMNGAAGAWGAVVAAAAAAGIWVAGFAVAARAGGMRPAARATRAASAGMR